MSYITVERQASAVGVAKTDETDSKDDLEVDNSKSVLEKIATLYADQLMSDLTLEVGGVGYPAHRLILCASSEVFQVMLMNREWSEWQESRIVLQETPIAASVFPHFLKYFYTGQIRISHKTVLPVLSLADKYNVKDLVMLCLSYMSQHVAQAAKLGVLISWMQYTMACGHNEVAKACQNFVKWNLEWVWSDMELGELEGETLVQLLQQSDLVLHNEMTLYQFVVRWLTKQRERLDSSELNEADKKTHWEALVAAVFSHVRFPMMCPNQLAKLLLCPLTQEHKDFFMERMAIAMSYQSGQYERVAEVQATEAGRMVFTPRLYTEDMWGSVAAVDNFHSVTSYETRTFMFSTRAASADSSSGRDALLEWTLDLYPKGVWFRKSLLIVWGGTYDVPEVVLRTVRISITCQSCPEEIINQYGEPEQVEPDVRVKIGILVWGVQKGVEHVSSVVERVHRFSAQNRVLNVDGALDFDELNTPLYTPGATPPHKVHGRCPKCADSCEFPEPRHLLGPNRDQLRVPEVVLHTVRISITCQSCPEEIINQYGEPEQVEPDVRVKIGILVWGVQKGVEHVSSVVERVHRFSAQNRVLNVDGALDFDELNTPLYTPGATPPHKVHGRCPKCADSCEFPEPRHLLGPNRDQLRVPEVVLHTVRISITCQSCPEEIINQYGEPEQVEPDVRVKIGILVWGVQKGVEHVSSVVERVHRFSAQNRVLNVDGALDFDELNTPLYTPGATPPHKVHGRCPKCADSCEFPEPRHLLGPNRDQLRIQVVIVPLTEYCHVGPPDCTHG